MEITKEKLNLEEGLKKEWLLTNGIGGFSSSTVIGANTRKYHGLLIAPLTPPARRFLVLSKLDESIEIRNKKYDLYTNVCKSYISHGYEYQEEFRKDYVPVFKYKIGKVEITKMICMEYGHNTVGVYYKVKNNGTKAKLTLAPIINFRDFHQMNTNHYFDIYQTVNKTKVKLVVDGNAHTPIYMNISEGEYKEHQNDTFSNMFYIEEEKRGFYPEENHAVPGVYEIEIPAKQEKEISFVCSLEENIEQKSVRRFINNEIIRLGEIFNTSLLIDNRKEKKTQKEREKDDLIKTYLMAADNFVVYRPNFGLHTIIAGYPWFLDWGRDSLIALEGLLLIPKRFEIAKEVLLTMIKDVKFGLIPNGYSGYDNRPLYNSVDASLLLFEQIQKYIQYTSDYEFVKEKMYPVLQDIIENYCQGIDVDNNNIYLDSDGLIVSGTEETQNTWMDAKYNGVAITPRNGKAVEINAMWYNANRIMSDLAKKFKHPIMAKKYKEIAEKCKISFCEKFYNEKKKCLYDVLGDEKIRPNQLFALSLTYSVLEPNSEKANQMLETVEKKLLNNYGLKTLAKDEENYVEVYEGSPEKRDSSYHQGITWPWLLGLYYNSLKNSLQVAKTSEEKKKINEKLEKFIDQTTKTFQKEIFDNGCIGGIAELYDSIKPQLPKGTINQAWSIAEVFRIILRK
jgi:predicted glycogen debranching enzyme